MRVLADEYLVSLKTPRALQYMFNFKIGGSTVRQLIESKIHRQFSFGKFNAISVDIPPVLADKLKDIPFISDVVANVRVTLFDEFQIENYGSAEQDDDENDSNDGDDNGSSIRTQNNAPRHLARISRRSQLPMFRKDDKSLLSYYYDSEDQGQDVYVYVLDSGINSEHPDFEGRAVKGIDTTGEGPGDLIGHGTHVAGLIGSKTYGVAKKVNLVEVKVLDSQGRGNVSDIIEGLEYVVNQCIAKKRKCVINMSLGAPGTHNILDKAVSAVIDEGIVVVVAAGNSGLNACWYSPAKVKQAITVAAMDDRTDLMASFSNWGACTDIWAPGVNVKSLSNRGDDKLVLSGTSMASPIVAGMAALFLDQGHKPDEIKKLITKRATKGVFKRRAIAVRPRTPNRVLFNGIQKDDDEFNYAVYPLIDENRFIDQLEEATGHVEPSNQPDQELVIHERRILSPKN